MTTRSRLPAAVLGILLILLGFAGIAFTWPGTPMEEPASPGRTPAPRKISFIEEWWMYRSVGVSRFIRYAGGAGGMACLVVGAMLLVAKRTTPH